VKNETGPYLAKRLKELLDHPLVGEVRNVGLMGAIELVKDKKTRKTFEPVGEVGTICRDHCFANGLVMRATKDTMMVSPPLTWTKGDIDEFMRLTTIALDLTAKDVGKK
jgi:putrescine aminotransferase